MRNHPKLTINFPFVQVRNLMFSSKSSMRVSSLRFSFSKQIGFNSCTGSSATNIFLQSSLLSSRCHHRLPGTIYPSTISPSANCQRSASTSSMTKLYTNNRHNHLGSNKMCSGKFFYSTPNTTPNFATKTENETSTTDETHAQDNNLKASNDSEYLKSQKTNQNDHDEHEDNNSYVTKKETNDIRQQENNKLALNFKHPWLCSTEHPRVETPSLWSKFKKAHINKANEPRIADLLQEPAYIYPDDFYTDIERQLRFFFKIVSYPNNKDLSENHLAPYMLRRLYAPWLNAHRHIQEIGGRYDFSVPKPYTFDNVPMQFTIANTHCTFGPYPVPHGYVAQNWGSMTLVVPEQDASFKNYVHQKKLEKQAQSEGVYIEIDVTVNIPIIYRAFNRNGTCFIEDKKSCLQLQFVSPHFGPWDEIYEAIGSDRWRLRWDWRMSDMDHLLAYRAPKKDRLPSIDWFSHRENFKLPGRDTAEKLLGDHKNDGVLGISAQSQKVDTHGVLEAIKKTHENKK